MSADLTRPPSDDRRRDDVDLEIEFHLESRVRDLVAAGLLPAAARAQALREFGDVDDARQYMRQIDEQVTRARRRERYMHDLRHDLTYAWRRLRAAPAFAVTAILTMTIGIGANTAIFSIVNGVLLRPLPFPQPDRLYAVYSANRTGGLLRASVSPVDLDDWRAGRRTIEDLGGYFYSEGSSGVDLTGRGAPRRLAAVYVTPGFFTTLGVQPQLGRLPREDEMVRGGKDTVVVLTAGFWRREFGGAPSAIGSSLTLNGVAYDVLGVLPESMRFPTDSADVFVPYSTIPDSAIPRLRQVRVLNVIARAAPAIGEAGVLAEMKGITGRLAAQFPEDRAWDGATVVPLAEVVTGPVRAGLLVLVGAVGLVLLIASVNVAVLQLARAMGRGREIAVRLALGARRGRLIRQLLTESLVISCVGGVLGLLLATGLVRGFLALGAGQIPRAADVTLDTTVLLFAAGVSIATGLVFGLVPALRTSRDDAQQLLHDTSRSITTAGNHRVRAVLVVCEVAVAMALVIGAGLMSRSFLALLDVDPGFRPDHLIAVQFTIDSDRHGAPAAVVQRGPLTASPYTIFYEQVIDAVRALPGVQSAAAVKDAPFRGNGERNGFALPGRAVPPGEDPPSATVIHVSDGYFATIGARMVDGREFTARDRADAPLVVVINEAFARQYLAGPRAVGQRLLLGRNIPAEVIGVVNDIRQLAMADPARPDDVPPQPAERARQDDDCRQDGGRSARHGQCHPPGDLDHRPRPDDHGRLHVRRRRQRCADAAAAAHGAAGGFRAGRADARGTRDLRHAGGARQRAAPRDRRAARPGRAAGTGAGDGRPPRRRADGARRGRRRRHRARAQPVPEGRAVWRRRRRSCDLRGDGRPAGRDRRGGELAARAPGGCGRSRGDASQPMTSVAECLRHDNQVAGAVRARIDERQLAGLDVAELFVERRKLRAQADDVDVEGAAAGLPAVVFGGGDHPPAPAPALSLRIDGEQPEVPAVAVKLDVDRRADDAGLLADQEHAAREPAANVIQRNAIATDEEALDPVRPVD